MRKTIWQPLILGTVFGLLAGTATATNLSFLTPGITDNAIGFYVTLFLLAAALGGPLAGAIAPYFEAPPGSRPDQNMVELEEVFHLD